MKQRVAACVLAVLMLSAPATAQDFIDWEQVTSRAAGTVIPVYDPVADDYRWIAFEDLLAGLVSFDDSLTRYIALSGAETAPTFTAADFLAGSSGTGFLDCHLFPAVPAMATAIWIAVAVPATWDLTWLDWGSFVSGFNSINVVQEIATPIDINGSSYTVWRSYRRHTAVFFGSGTYMCMHQDATIPTP